jgi:hypothetical protein
MGTKGSKNTPITARISTGLFNQKKGVKEPLLDVGPAGVSGNNQTRDIPSPSKMKGYSMKASPFKQAKVGVNVVKSESTGDQIVKGGKITRGKSWDDLRAEGMSEEKITEAKAWRKKNPTVARDQVDTGESEPDTVIPGTTTETNEFTPTQTRDNNDAMSPWRVRQQSRSIKKSGKDVRQSKNKLNKTNRRLAGMDEADKVVGNKKYDRLMSKKSENTTELDAFNKNMTARTRQVEMSSDPLGKSGTFKSASRNMELPDASSTYDGQTEIIKKGGVKKPSSIDFGEIGKTEDTDTEKLSGALKKKTPDFFKKKSPLKMKYFK